MIIIYISARAINQHGVINFWKSSKQTLPTRQLCNEELYQLCNVLLYGYTGGSKNPFVVSCSFRILRITLARLIFITFIVTRVSYSATKTNWNRVLDRILSNLGVQTQSVLQPIPFVKYYLTPLNAVRTYIYCVFFFNWGRDVWNHFDYQYYKN